MKYLQKVLMIIALICVVISLATKSDITLVIAAAAIAINVVLTFVKKK